MPRLYVGIFVENVGAGLGVRYRLGVLRPPRRAQNDIAFRYVFS